MEINQKLDSAIDAVADVARTVKPFVSSVPGANAVIAGIDLVDRYIDANNTDNIDPAAIAASNISVPTDAESIVQRMLKIESDINALLVDIGPFIRFLKTDFEKIRYIFREHGL